MIELKRKKRKRKKRKNPEKQSPRTVKTLRNVAVCMFLLGQLEEGDRLGRAHPETKAVLFIHTMKSHFSRTPLKKKKAKA